MSKIKLLTLLLISFCVFSCASNQINDSKQKYSIAYIGGEYDGLLLENYLRNGLKNLKIYDQDASVEIQANISHSSNLYITNIDNTSDREKIITEFSVRIKDNRSNCIVFEDEIIVSQFYIYASSDKFLSNQAAVRKIKKDNTESTVRQFINKLKKINSQCNE